MQQQAATLCSTSYSVSQIVRLINWLHLSKTNSDRIFIQKISLDLLTTQLKVWRHTSLLTTRWFNLWRHTSFLTTHSVEPVTSFAPVHTFLLNFWHHYFPSTHLLGASLMMQLLFTAYLLLTFTLKHRPYPQLNPERSPVLYLSATPLWGSCPWLLLFSSFF